MAYKRKTWQEKMKLGMEPIVEKTAKKFADIPEGAIMVIPTPEVVMLYIKNIPFGTQTTLQQMRKDLSAIYNAEFCCPITSGIFLRIVAEAAHEELSQGKTIDEITPFWRMIDAKSPINNKLSFSADFIKEQRWKEGLSY